MNASVTNVMNSVKSGFKKHINVNAAVNGWDTMRASKYATSARATIDKVASHRAVRASKNLGKDIGARGGIFPMQSSFKSNIGLGIMGGAALGAGSSYMTDGRVSASSMLKGAAYGAGAGVGMSVFKGVRGSYKSGVLGARLNRIKNIPSKTRAAKAAADRTGSFYMPSGVADDVLDQMEHIQAIQQSHWQNQVSGPQAFNMRSDIGFDARQAMYDSQYSNFQMRG